jgi:hypothetical protein
MVLEEGVKAIKDLDFIPALEINAAVAPFLHERHQGGPIGNRLPYQVCGGNAIALEQDQVSWSVITEVGKGGRCCFVEHPAWVL